MRASMGIAATLALCALVSLGTLGCNTFRGAGKDIQKGGEAVENAAENVQHGNDHPRSYTIVASAESGGSISPSGNVGVAHGTSRAFTIRAHKGYYVADVLLDGKSVGATSRYTCGHVTAGHTISARFAQNPSR